MLFNDTKEEKSCTQCKKTKPLTEYQLSTTQKSGFETKCKACRKEQRKQHAQKAETPATQKLHLELKKAKADAKEKRREADKPIIAAKRKARVKAYREANKESFNEYRREWRKNNPDKEREQSRRSEAKRNRPESHREYQKKYKQEHKVDTETLARYMENARQARFARKMYSVYRIDFVSGAFYIGSSNAPNLRFNSHKSKAQRGESSKVLNVQDWSTATWQVLVVCETEPDVLAEESNLIEGCMTDPKCLNMKIKENRMHPYWVYVIQSEQPRTSKDGRELGGFFYVGMTTDPARRLRQHNGDILGGGKYTSKHRPWIARALHGPYPNRSSALKAEYALKRQKRGEGRLRWTTTDSPHCCGEGVNHPWVQDSTGWSPPKTFEDAIES